MLVASILIWIAAALLVPAPTAARAFLIVPLVLVPRILETDRRGRLRWVAFIAALPLAFSFAFAHGTTALALALPWLAVTGFLAAILGDRTVHGRTRTVAIAAGVALLVGVPMGPIWASAQLFGFDFLALETMVRVHGMLNLAGTVAAALVLVRGPAA